MIAAQTAMMMMSARRCMLPSLLRMARRYPGGTPNVQHPTAYSG
jgi:hypothetical protein